MSYIENYIFKNIWQVFSDIIEHHRIDQDWSKMVGSIIIEDHDFFYVADRLYKKVIVNFDCGIEFVITDGEMHDYCCSNNEEPIWI